MKHNMFAPFYRNGMLQIILCMRLIDTYFVEIFLIGIIFAYCWSELVLQIIVDDLETKV